MGKLRFGELGSTIIKTWGFNAWVEIVKMTESKREVRDGEKYLSQWLNALRILFGEEENEAEVSEG